MCLGVTFIHISASTSLFSYFRQLSDLGIIYLPTWLLLYHKSVCFLLEALGDPRLSISEGDQDQVRVRDKSALAKLVVYQNSGSRMSAQN